MKKSLFFFYTAVLSSRGTEAAAAKEPAEQKVRKKKGEREGKTAGLLLSNAPSSVTALLLSRCTVLLCWCNCVRVCVCVCVLVCTYSHLFAGLLKLAFFFLYLHFFYTFTQQLCEDCCEGVAREVCNCLRHLIITLLPPHLQYSDNFVPLNAHLFNSALLISALYLVDFV